mmetsp:Transcript_8965/g.20541  ORF Transcript_8965/g.20541 Transcript_8965/m.20541 type:complete len:203 (+) Transcript_8965:3692-4300(+)
MSPLTVPSRISRPLSSCWERQEQETMLFPSSSPVLCSIDTEDRALSPLPSGGRVEGCQSWQTWQRKVLSSEKEEVGDFIGSQEETSLLWKGERWRTGTRSRPSLSTLHKVTWTVEQVRRWRRGEVEEEDLCGARVRLLMNSRPHILLFSAFHENFFCMRSEKRMTDPSSHPSAYSMLIARCTIVLLVTFFFMTTLACEKSWG